jgi:hypothetical protein
MTGAHQHGLLGERAKAAATPAHPSTARGRRLSQRVLPTRLWQRNRPQTPPRPATRAQGRSHQGPDEAVGEKWRDSAAPPRDWTAPERRSRHTKPGRAGCAKGPMAGDTPLQWLVAQAVPHEGPEHEQRPSMAPRAKETLARAPREAVAARGDDKGKAGPQGLEHRSSIFP